MTNINLDACKRREKEIEHICKKRERTRAHLIDVKENNLRWRESLERNDRQREKDKVASHSRFFPFLSLSTNRRKEIIGRENERERERERENIEYI